MNFQQWLAKIKWEEMSWEDIISLAEKFVTFPLFKIGQTPVTLGSLVVFVFLMALVGLTAHLVRRIMTRWLSRRTDIEEGTRYTLVRVTQYAIVVFGLFFSFQFIGFDLSGLAVIFGLLSVGIGFGLQNVTSNFISGLILLLERPIRVGDRVVVGETEGDVIDINIRSTTIRSLENVSIIVPNSEFVSNRVVNRSHGDRRVRMPIDVGVSYSSDVDVVLAALAEVAEEHPEVLKHPKPDIHHRGFGDSAWDMRLWIWLADPKSFRRIRSELNCAIIRKFREKGVEIPFPQRDLHVRSSVPLPVEQGERIVS